MKREIKYTKNISWVKPFVESVKDLIPIKNITHVRGYQIKYNLNEVTQASTIVNNTTNDITINLLVKSYNKTKKLYKCHLIHYILDCLAHELAHTVEWEHTSKHYKIQARIMLRFSTVIKKLGIKDTSWNPERLKTNN